MVICNEEHRFLVAEQLRQLNKLSNNIILEPVGRNTAPAIALAALQATRHGDDPLMLVLAADHIINNQPVFHDAIRVAEQYADEGHLVTFGIVPNAPETGYGYIQRGVALTDSAHTPYQVARFVEKPDRERAEAYLASGEYYWNSGMFMFRAKKYLSELAKFRPDILEACQAAVNAADNGSDFISIPHDIFCECPDESVDYAVMEKTADAVVVGLDADWSDVGSWSALWEVSPKDEQGNVLSGDAWVHNSENCYINSDEKLVAAIGVENLVIVSTKDAVLVMNRERSQDVKKAVEFLKQNQRSEYKRHREIYRPWGRCDVVVQTPALQRQPHHRETGGCLLNADAPPPRRALGHSRRHRSGDGQRQAVPADREPVHLYSDWRRAQPGKPGPYSAGSAGDPVGVVPRRGRHYSY
ncbi:mannose-1-phosphate guanylyltransferase [Klebsiella variicola]|nr:mannose-1-phosphate guanylyltransferase [Klebsiella variicola]